MSSEYVHEKQKICVKNVEITLRSCKIEFCEKLRLEMLSDYLKKYYNFFFHKVIELVAINIAIEKLTIT